MVQNLTRLSRGAVALACCLATAPAGHSAQLVDNAVPRALHNQASRRAKLRDVLERFRAESKFPGAVAGAWFSDGSSVVAAVGLADLERRTAMRETSLLHAGSVGKTLFAALVLQLVAENRLRLDENVSRYLGREPWYSGVPNGADITVRMLLNHTSGIPAPAPSSRSMR